MPPNNDPFMTFITFIWEHFTEFITVISPIIIAWCGWKVQSSEKESKKYREQRERIEQLEKKARDDEVKAQNAAIENIGERLDRVQSDLEKIDTGRIYERIDEIANMTNANFQYSQSLSKVVICLGDAIEGAKEIETSGRIKNAIAKHQDKERDIVSRLCKIQI